VFLDEPSSSLDPKSRREIHHLIRQLALKGTAVVFSSHDMEEVHKLAERVVMIANGKVVAEGTSEQLLIQYETDNLDDLYMKLVDIEMEVVC
jgi:ABC-2 type transport system ATP-binding protein